MADLGQSVVRLEVGDCIEVMAAMPTHCVDAIVTDPPYGLGFMGKEWDRFTERGDHAMRRNPAVDAVNAGASRQGGRQRASSDFQRRQARDARSYQEWCEAWGREALRVLRPGGCLLAFGGTRMYHRLVSGLEDCGFEIRDQIDWLYGSGFPKHPSALKPAHEPIVLARSASTRSEPLNIDACRVGWGAEGDKSAERKAAGYSEAAKKALGGVVASESATGFTGEVIGTDASLGRWPANVVLDPEAAAMLDEQTGELTSGANPTRRSSDKFRDVYGDFKGQEECDAARAADSGGASRFFYVAKPDDAERQAGLAVHGLFTPADAPERNDHPTVKPIDLMRWLCRLVTPPGGTVLDPFTGSGTTGCAAALEGFSFIGIEREPAYAAIARARLAHWTLGAAA